MIILEYFLDVSLPNPKLWTLVVGHLDVFFLYHHVAFVVLYPKIILLSQYFDRGVIISHHLKAPKNLEIEDQIYLFFLRLLYGIFEFHQRKELPEYLIELSISVKFRIHYVYIKSMLSWRYSTIQSQQMSLRSEAIGLVSALNQFFQHLSFPRD